MAARKKGGRQQQVKGFRPGKEPARLKKQRAKAQLGKDASWAQKRAVEAVAGRSPQEVRKMVQTWSRGLIAGGVVLAVVGFVLYGWAVAAGVVAHILSAALLFLGYRLGKQGSGLVDLADSL